MNTPKEIVAFYVERFQSGNGDDAFHGLLDSGVTLIPELIDAYEDTNSRELKVFVIKVVSEFRDPSAFGFLRHALRRDEEEIWRAALDGLSMAASSESIDSMDHVLHGTLDPDKNACILEAISDTRAEMDKDPRIPKK